MIKAGGNPKFQNLWLVVPREHTEDYHEAFGRVSGFGGGIGTTSGSVIVMNLLSLRVDIFDTGV
jgi:hypothetical protein